MAELKPCPFCGGEANLVGYGVTGVMKVVQCSDCGARTRAFDPKVKRGENAIEAWNRRVDRQPTIEPDRKNGYRDGKGYRPYRRGERYE